MKVSVLGADGNILCPLLDIRRGFSELGHIHVEDALDPDVAFAFIGNAPFKNYLDLPKSKKTIFKVLDIPIHVREVNEIISNFKEQLPLAHKVCSNSKFVQRQLRELCQIDSEVIYDAMKPVHYSGRKKFKYRAMMVGRLLDPNKRARIGAEALFYSGFKSEEVAIVGPEYIGWGDPLGLVGTEVLNDLYNSVDYVLMPSRIEGIGLPAIEAACCGAIPIVLPDLSTFDEFWAESPLGLHYQTLTSPAKVAELILAIEQNPEWKAQIKQDMLAYSTLAFRPKFEAKAVANRIIEIFHTL